jgi:hypothetical protein
MILTLPLVPKPQFANEKTGSCSAGKEAEHRASDTQPRAALEFPFAILP